MSEKFHKPVVIVNLKSYLEGINEKALKLAKCAEKIAEETSVFVGLAPQNVDLRLLTSSSSIPVFGQHTDIFEPGAHTGHISAETLNDTGAIGSLINHSEKQLKLSDIDKIIKRLKQLNLVSVVCSNTSTVSAAAAGLNPDMVAIEPPELIGSGIAVSTAKPEIITDTVRLIKSVNPNVTVLCGAGITKGEDVSSAMKLGAEGILVASGVVKAKDPCEALKELAEHACSYKQ